MDKAARLLAMVRQRQATRWPGYNCIGDYHDGIYECDFVSPYTKSAGNIDATVMILLQDWASHDVLAGPVLQARLDLGHDPVRHTNRNLKLLLRTHLHFELCDVYASNVFPFVKLGRMNSTIPMRDLVSAAHEFTLPEIEIVRPRFVVCLGKAAFDAISVAAGHRRHKTLAEAIHQPFVLGATQVWCQAHTGLLGMNGRNRGGAKRVDADWSKMAAAYKSATQVPERQAASLR